MNQVILQQHLGVGNALHCADKHERNLTFFARCTWLWFIISFDLFATNKNKFLCAPISNRYRQKRDFFKNKERKKEKVEKLIDFFNGNSIHVTAHNLIVTSSQTNLHSDHAALVHNLLDDPPILADHLSDQIARHLDRLLAVLEHGARLFDRIIAVAEDLERARLLLQLNVGDAD
jgi:hypothetical protein